MTIGSFFLVISWLGSFATAFFASHQLLFSQTSIGSAPVAIVGISLVEREWISPYYLFNVAKAAKALWRASRCSTMGKG